MKLEQADLVVVGSGQGGVPLAAEFARAGKRVVLFERGALGGTCVNVGCTPSKAFLASAHAAGRARQAEPLAVHAHVEVDQHAVLRRVRKLRDEWRAGVERRLHDAGVEVVRAHGAFAAERTIEGGGRRIQGRNVVLDVGGGAVVPPIDGLAGTPFLTNANFFDQAVLPSRLIVIGGGYIGLELGQGARRLGSAVTIVHAGARVLDREEADASAVVQAALIADGIDLRLTATTRAVAYHDNFFTLDLGAGGAVVGDGLLVATGRRASTDGLAPERSRIELNDNGTIRVDEHLQTTCPGVYALGDAAGQPAFTHVAWEDYRRISSTLAGTPRTRDDRVLSYTTFTEPQLARTGLDEAQARKRGLDVRVVTLPLANVARAIEWNLEAGFFRLVVDAKSDRIAGATFVGYEAGELIHVIVALIECGATWQTLDRAMFIHPTLAEGLPSLARLLA
ncbi:MAG: FAD-dependent oxidoreductase [Vulcanimicrobiaceae bacterium]